jgi:hypothetical protein
MTADTMLAVDDEGICEPAHASADTVGLRPHCTF